ncbi:MAG TPA: ECF-type sigma factor [Thermoanaerobaculia bacterium]|nr:ECF-type sigma factor [Thermoanaerobaculia bacterium]
MADLESQEPPAEAISQLFDQWRAGDARALDELLPLIYAEMKRLASRQMRRESPGLTFQTTELVHEVYLRLFGRRPLEIHDRNHFFAIATQTMRRVLVDGARRALAGRRPPKSLRAEMEPAELDRIADPGGTGEAADVLALDAALERLTALDARQARIVELRFFGGMTLDETATVLEVSEATVTRDWRAARAWLKTELAGAGARLIG